MVSSPGLWKEISFVSTSLALLLAPGPTNTLLIFKGATNGSKGLLWLLLAEVFGYLAAFHILAYAIGPFFLRWSVAQQLLRLLLAAYMLFLAFQLWGIPAASSKCAVTPLRIFMVTLFNPKALVFTFFVLPPLATRWLAALPQLGLLCLMIVMVSISCIYVGVVINKKIVPNIQPKIIRRVGAAVLALVALIICAPINIRP